MSFLNEILKQKQRLQQTESMVTTADGRTHVERNTGLVVARTTRTSHGFVVDTCPDNVPALVIDHLYVGSQDCTSVEVLTTYSIKHVLSLGVEVSVDVNYKHIPCLDLPETDIKPVLQECVPFIETAVQRSESVLVHCNAGVSRAAMAVIGYLICVERYSYEDAYRIVKESRPAVQPNVGFVKQLKLLSSLELGK